MIFVRIRGKSRAHANVTLNRARRVDPKGELRLSAVGSIKAAGSTIDELRKAIRAACEKTIGLAGDADVRVLKAASVATCLSTLYTSEAGKDLYPLRPRSRRRHGRS